MPRCKNMILLLFISTGLFGCSSANVDDNHVELTISAAASLKNALEEIEMSYEADHMVDININFAASGTLRKQIEQGAPVDLFFSADELHFNTLVNNGFIEEKDATNLLKNELVFIVPKDSGLQSIEDIRQVKQLAIGIPETVPAGKYAKEALENLKLWDELSDKIITAKDVRQVLSYVETGNVEAGVVYKTDAATTKNVKEIAVIDSALHTPIVYPVGILKGTKEQKAASDFFQYLQGEDSLNIFNKYGFNGVD